VKSVVHTLSLRKRSLKTDSTSIERAKPLRLRASARNKQRAHSPQKEQKEAKGEAQNNPRSLCESVALKTQRVITGNTQPLRALRLCVKKSTT